MKKGLILFILFNISIKAQTVGLIQNTGNNLQNGYVLFAPNNGLTTYLIDKCGKQVKTWTSAYKLGQSVYILDDGTLLRTGNPNNTTFNAGGKGGVIEKFDWNGNVTWSYTISDTQQCQHHDVKGLPNGNVLAIVWEKKTVAEAIAKGRNPNLIAASVWSEKIIEIQPSGKNGGNIVWEWHLWDHLIQDFDNTKPDFGVVSANPQKIDINFAATANAEDWQHINAIDYNESLNQIVLSSHNSDEIWIIDHSTTTDQSASNTGGNSNKGGDILYRWGNPRSYKMGTNADQKFFGQHNAYWIPKGYPFENQIMVFNNGNGRTGGNYCTVEIINPPVNGYNYTATTPFLPTAFSWNYNSGNTQNWYAQNISGAQQLSNGNVLICSGPTGTFLEVDATGNTLWKYINPIKTTGIISQGTVPTQNTVFRCTFYPTDFVGFKNKTITTGTIIENSNTISSSCNLNLSLSKNQILGGIKIYPNPAKEQVQIEFQNENNQEFKIEIMNILGSVLYSGKTNSNKISIDTKAFSKRVYFVRLNSDSENYTQKLLIE